MPQLEAFCKGLRNGACFNCHLTRRGQIAALVGDDVFVDAVATFSRKIVFSRYYS